MRACVAVFVVVLTFTLPAAYAETSQENQTVDKSWLASVRNVVGSAVIDIPLMVGIHEMNPPCLKTGLLKTCLETRYNIMGNKNRALVLLSNALAYAVLSPSLKFIFNIPSPMGLLRTSTEVSTMVALHMLEKVPGTTSVAQYLTFCTVPARAAGGACCARPMVPTYMFRNAAVGWLVMHAVSALVH